MQYCAFCKVSVAGNKHCCPLCGGALTGEAEPDTEVFPKLEKPRVAASFAIHLMTLITVVIDAACVMINVALKSEIWWSLLVVLGTLCALATASVAIAHRRDLSQNVTWQIILITLLSLIWDRSTGWRGWSIDFALPCVCAAGLLALLVVAIVLHPPLRAFAGRMVICCLIGLVPFVLVLAGKINIILPSLICSGFAVVLLAALVLFGWETVKGEAQRRLHI